MKTSLPKTFTLYIIIGIAALTLAIGYWLSTSQKQIDTPSLSTSANTITNTSEIKSIHNNMLTALAQEARLVAERDNLDVIIFPNQLIKQQQNLSQLLTKEQSLFKSRQANFHNTLGILTQRIEQLREDIQSYEAQLTFLTKQLSIAQNEWDQEKNQPSNTQTYQLERETAHLETERDETVLLLKNAQQAVKETLNRMTTYEQTHQEEISQTLKETRQEIETLKQQKNALRNSTSINPT